MSLTLLFHPLSSFCWKALVALYEGDISFERHVLDLLDETVRQRFRTLWPLGKMPVLRDEARGRTVPEATIIIEYLATHYPACASLVPSAPELAWQVRLRDRLFDLYVSDPMQKIVGDRLRPEGAKDPQGVEQARSLISTTYAVIEREMSGRTWAVGDDFTMADCSAAPALYYANLVAPLGDAHPNAAAYLARLMARPSFARVLAEAEPYRSMFPKE